MTSILQLNSVTKHYGDVRAVDDLSLDLAAGEFGVLLGLNGAGKSTLFQLLTALFTPDCGQIIIDGNNLPSRAVNALARMGVVFQQPTMDLDLTVRQNLRFHARLHGMGKRADARINEELGRIGLSDRADDKVRKLSGGNRRRVELARALLHEPALLLMDEPTVGLDPESRQSLVDYVHRLRREKGTAILWATHLVDEADRADRVFIIHHGRLIAEQTPQGLCDQSEAETLAAAFIKLTGNWPAAEEDA